MGLYMVPSRHVKTCCCCCWSWWWWCVCHSKCGGQFYGDFCSFNYIWILRDRLRLSGFSGKDFYHLAHQLATLCIKCTYVPGRRSHWHFVPSSFICSHSPPTLTPLSPCIFCFHAFLTSLTQKLCARSQLATWYRLGF